MCATLHEDIYHTSSRMLVAICGCLAALDIKARPPRTGVIRTMLRADIPHAVRSMLAAIHRCLALEIEARTPSAGVI